MRVIFDRSAFHGDRFQVLVRSPLRNLVMRGKVKVFLTPVFTQETLDQYGSGRARNVWRDHLRFAAEICNGGIFLDKSDIFRNELISGEGASARYLFPSRRTRRYEYSASEALGRLRLVANSDDSDLLQAWRLGQAQRDEVQRKKDAQKSYYVKVRQDIGDAMRGGYLRSSWQKHLDIDFLSAGRHFMKFVDKGRQGELADVWASNPWRYPFYSAFVEGLVYTLYHAAEERNAKIDRNSQADYEQLAFLTWADAVISNDTKFLRQAFDALWKPRGKRIFTTEEFAELVAVLS